jgi:hypothetical protein
MRTNKQEQGLHKDRLLQRLREITTEILQARTEYVTHNDLIRAAFEFNDNNLVDVSRRRFPDRGNGTRSHPAIIDPDSDDDNLDFENLVPRVNRFERDVPLQNPTILEVLLHTVCDFCLNPSIDGVPPMTTRFPEGLSNDDLLELVQLLNLLKAVEQLQHSIISSDHADSVPLYMHRCEGNGN